MSFSERLGLILGYALGVATAAISFIRQARTFHPRGLAFVAQVTPLQGNAFSESLRGQAIVRLSSAWWKNKEWRDVLGLALRIHKQDLLLATITHPWTLPVSAFFTKYHDFLKNNYYGVSHFSIPGQKKVKIRLAPKNQKPKKPSDLSRTEQIKLDVKTGNALFLFQVSPLWKTNWTSVAEIQLTGVLDINPEELKFSPFQNGLQIVPRGFIHHLRVGAYAMSRFGRGET
jgi:hypothetical protein